MRDTVNLNITIPEDHVLVLVQKISKGRRLRVFKNLGETGKQAESQEDYAVIVSKEQLSDAESMLSAVDNADEENIVEIGKILSLEAQRDG